MLTVDLHCVRETKWQEQPGYFSLQRFTQINLSLNFSRKPEAHTQASHMSADRWHDWMKQPERNKRSESQELVMAGGRYNSETRHTAMLLPGIALLTLPPLNVRYQICWMSSEAKFLNASVSILYFLNWQRTLWNLLLTRLRAAMVPNSRRKDSHSRVQLCACGWRMAFLE